MGMFASILTRLGINGPAAPAPTPAVAAAAPATATLTAPGPTAIPVVDVVARLEGLAAASSQKLNWKTSIVDLLKLLGLDSSLTARKELATELDCPAEAMADSAKMNMWLHKAVMQKLAANGGNVPRELMD